MLVDEACCPPLMSQPLDPGQAEALSETLKVLADPARLRLLSLIAARDEACVCDLTEPVGLSQPTVSHHMKVLHEAGLVDREQRGRWVYYRARPDRLAPIRDALAV